MNISSWRQLIPTISANERLPSATATGHFRDLSQWDDSEKQAADRPQITGCLFQENKQSFSFWGGGDVRCPPELQELCFNWRASTA